MGHSCLAFARAGLGYIYDKSKITRDSVCYVVKRVNGEAGNKRNDSEVQVLLATDRAVSYVNVQCQDNEQD